MIYHSSFIGRAGPKFKGRISSFLANKCSIAARIDCYTDTPTAKFGEALKQQVEERLAFFETGEPPSKNADAMRKVFEQLALDQDEDESDAEGDAMEVDVGAKKKGKGKSKEAALPFMDVDVTPTKEKKEKKKKRKSEDAEMDVDGEESDESAPKKKVKLSKEEKKALKKEKKKERKEKEAAEVSFMNVFSCLPTLWRRMLTRTPLWLGRRVEKGEEGEEREEREEGKEGEEEQRVALYNS